MWYVCSMRDFILSLTDPLRIPHTYTAHILALLNYFLPSEESIGSNFPIASFSISYKALGVCEVHCTNAFEDGENQNKMIPKNACIFKGPGS